MTLTAVNVPKQRHRVIARRLLLVAAALAVVLFAGYLWAATSYRLDHGSSSWHGADADSGADASRTAVRFVFSPGKQVTFGVSIRNPGPVPVMITRVVVDDGPTGYEPIFKVVSVAVNADSSTAVFDQAAATPLRSMRIGPGKELPVFVTITMPDVEMSPGGGLFVDDFTVDYEVLGLFRHQQVPMGFRLLLQPAPNGDAPR
jgi:uncharacterized repeat protein (TIGR01451 family)